MSDRRAATRSSVPLGGHNVDFAASSSYQEAFATRTASAATLARPVDEIKREGRWAAGDTSTDRRMCTEVFRGEQPRDTGGPSKPAIDLRNHSHFGGLDTRLSECQGSTAAQSFMGTGNSAPPTRDTSHNRTAPALLGDRGRALSAPQVSENKSMFVGHGPVDRTGAVVGVQRTVDLQKTSDWAAPQCADPMVTTSSAYAALSPSEAANAVARAVRPPVGQVRMEDNTATGPLATISQMSYTRRPVTEALDARARPAHRTTDGFIMAGPFGSEQMSTTHAMYGAPPASAPAPVRSNGQSGGPSPHMHLGENHVDPPQTLHQRDYAPFAPRAAPERARGDRGVSHLPMGSKSIRALTTSYEASYVPHSASEAAEYRVQTVEDRQRATRGTLRIGQAGDIAGTSNQRQSYPDYGADAYSGQAPGVQRAATVQLGDATMRDFGTTSSAYDASAQAAAGVRRASSSPQAQTMDMRRTTFNLGANGQHALGSEYRQQYVK
eukprot:m51a1_g13127 hypothetical protein (495) ;mRNA; r:486-2290